MHVCSLLSYALLVAMLDVLCAAGMQPLFYSERGAREREVGWVRCGRDISYTRNYNNLQCPLLGRDRNYYLLEWKMVLPHENIQTI